MSDKIAYRPDEAAKSLGISRTHVHRLITRGQLRAGKVGSCTVIHRDELDRFVREQIAAAPVGRVVNVREGNG